MSKFITPQELEQHLAALVDDEAFILRTIRATFPEYKLGAPQMSRDAARAVRKEEQSRSIKANPLSFVFSDMSEREARANIITGSRKLLEALWAHHGPILHHFQMNGLQVAAA